MAEEAVVILTGIEETISELKKFDEKAVRQFNKLVNTELGNAETAAHRLVDNIRG